MDIRELEKANLLVLSSAFPFGSDYRGTFVKGQLEILKDYFDHIHVIMPLSFFPKFMLHSGYFKKFSGYNGYPKNYVIDNINIFFPRFFPLPINDDLFLRYRSSLILKATNNLIQNHNLKFDLIHAHFVYPSGYVGIKIKERSGLPLVLTAHGGDIYRQPFRSVKQFEMTKKILSNADRIITTSQRNCNIITGDFGIEPEKVAILSNGFNENFFYIINKNKARQELSLPLRAKIILSIGNLIEIKGHCYLIEAIKKILLTYNDILCIIIGHGDKSKLNDQIKSLGLESHILIVNGVPHEKIPIWINACDLFVLPSLDEGSPTVLPEVMACGKPTIAASVGGIPEIIREKDIGLLVRAKDSDEIAEKILLALEKKWDAHKIAQYAKDNYTWENISKRMLELYLEIIL